MYVIVDLRFTVGLSISAIQVLPVWITVSVFWTVDQ